MYDAIILAGGENKGLGNCAVERYEAMIEIAGKPMVVLVAEALAATGKIDKIFVVGPYSELQDCQFPVGTTVLAAGNTIMQTIQIGMAALPSSQPVLVVTADIPLLTPEAVDDFLEQCAWAGSAELYYPIVAKETNEQRYPKSQRTYVRLREGVFTGGNIFLVDPEIVPRCLEIAERIFAYRKNPLKLCRIIGWHFVFKFIFRCLTLREVERRFSAVLGIRGAVILSRFPEVGIDVDKPSDLELVKTAFAMKSKINTL